MILNCFENCDCFENFQAVPPGEFGLGFWEPGLISGRLDKTLINGCPHSIKESIPVLLVLNQQFRILTLFLR